MSASNVVLKCLQSIGDCPTCEDGKITCPRCKGTRSSAKCTVHVQNTMYLVVTIIAYIVHIMVTI